MKLNLAGKTTLGKVGAINFIEIGPHETTKDVAEFVRARFTHGLDTFESLKLER